MIDYEQIGKRINEERKYLRKISQEKMAEDLGMYQADISNLEKAKSGSGITDLTKLEMIADYFDIPLEKLLFGQEEKNMIKYHGTKMQLENKGVVKKIRKAHKEKLETLTGKKPEEINTYCFVCGPYYIYIATEYQMEMDTVDGELKPVASIPKHHFYCFMNDVIVGTMTAAAANVMSMINQELLLGLRNMIQPDVLDPTDVCRTINPYWALMQFEEDEAEREQVATKMFARMEELKQEADRVILFIESAYVREGYRRNGMMRLMLDVADVIAENPIMWLNLEPTAGFELDEEYTYLPHYVQAAEGQLSENAAAAEKLGFTIDPDVWHKRIYIEDENGNVRDEVVEMRKCAYKIPSEIKEIIKDDGNLVEIGRAKQKALHMKQEVEAYNDGVVDIYSTSLDSDEYKDLENNWTMIQDEGSTFYDENGEKKGCVHEVAYRCESGLREGDVVYLYGMFMNGEKSFVESETSMLKMIREENFPQDDNELRAWEYESLEETSISEFSEVFVELSTVLDEIMNEKTKI